MANDRMEAGISVEWVKTGEEPFRPEAATTIFAELTPIEKDVSTYYPSDYLDFYKTILPPYVASYEAVPDFEAPTGELIINIETTGTKPWESRLICIGVLDPNVMEPVTMNFIEEDEEKTLNSFLEWFEAAGYTTLIGYNVSFDYRFLYALMQKYRRWGRGWKGMELYDLMQQQKQVKDEYVFGYNPTGTLEEWSTYLLGTRPYAKQEQVFKWYREKNVQEIVNFNSDKLTKAYYLWVLDKVVGGTIPGTEVLGRPGTPVTEAPEGSAPSVSAAEENMIQVECPVCHDAQFMSKSAKVINCRVCGTPIANPAV